MPTEENGRWSTVDGRRQEPPQKTSEARIGWDPKSVLLTPEPEPGVAWKRQGRSLDLDGPHTHPRGGCLARFFALSEDLLCQLIVFLE